MAAASDEKGARGEVSSSARAKRRARARRLIATLAAPAIAAFVAGLMGAPRDASAEGGSAADPSEPASRKSKSAGATPEKKSVSGALPVSLAEVASRVDGAVLGGQSATDLLRKDVEAEIAAADWSKLPPRKHYKLSASIVALKAEELDKKTLRASCTVSVSIRDAKRGNLLAILEGRAKVEDLASASSRAQRDALTGAVRGAMAAVPEAIRQSQ